MQADDIARGITQRDPSCLVDVRLDDLIIERAVSVGSGEAPHRTDGINERGDLNVSGRDDLASVTEIDLDPIVHRRVVTRRHHDSGVSGERAHGVREDRCRKGSREDQRRHTSSAHHLSDIACEGVRVVARVVTDDDTWAVVVEQEIGRQARRGLRDGHPIDPMGAGPHAPS